MNNTPAPGPGYGWISILLHWATAIAIVILLFAGDSIGETGHEARRVHTTVAACAYLLLAARVAWRLIKGHPPSMSGRDSWSHRAGLFTHYVMLAAITLMLVSGPLAGWATGGGFEIFDWKIAGAATEHPPIARLSLWLHGTGAATLALAIVLHVAGAMKHMFVDKDGLFDRIMVAAGKGQERR